MAVVCAFPAVSASAPTMQTAGKEGDQSPSSVGFGSSLRITKSNSLRPEYLWICE
jgi:hypothetical protein